MATQLETIYSQFKNAGVPATGLSATISIMTVDGVSVVTSEPMTEIVNAGNPGRYKYDFADYNKKIKYLITTDGGATLSDTDRYQYVANELDAYENKGDWKGGGGGVVQNIDTKQLAKDVWSQKTKEFENKAGTMGEKLTSLDMQEAIDKLNKIKIPDNSEVLSNIESKIDDVVSKGNVTRTNVKEIKKTLGDTVTQIENNANNIYEWTNTQKEEISNKIDDKNKEIISEIQNIEKIDYDRIKKDIEDNKVSLESVLFEINDLKRTIIDEIKKNNYLSMRKFIENSVDSRRLVENSQEMMQIKQDFDNSVSKIKESIEELSKKEIDFSEILESISKTQKEIEETKANGQEVKENIIENYKKQMKYIIYTAKNIGSIGKNDFQEIKKSLLSLKK